jgi:uncharacterized membrane protein YhaH (DUF805 family)
MTRQPTLRTTPILLSAAAVALSAAWALRGHTGPPPTPSARAHALAEGGHHGSGGGTLPPPVIGDALANTVGLVALTLIPLALGITVAAVAARRLTVGRTGAGQWLTFAALAAVAAAIVTVAVAAVSLAGAVSFTGSLAAAATVLRDTFVVVVAASAAFGVPWRTSPPSESVKGVVTHVQV